MRIKWTSASRKHRISRDSSRYVVEHPVYRGPVPAPAHSPLTDPRELFVGPDHNGAELEVIGVALDDGTLLIIHSMKLRNKYRHHLEGDTE